MTDTPPEKWVRLSYLDGVRGLAALYVVLHHVFQSVYTGLPDGALATLPRWFGPLSALFKFGGYAVAVFIVLSGYCLMLPVARSERHELAGGIRGFAVRRARRILPAYYATVTLSVALILLVPEMRAPAGTLWDISHPAEALSVGSLLSHALLCHNLIGAWNWTLNPPLWSVALEWQIYFLFALVLLPVWRRWGSRAALPLAFTLGIVPVLLGRGFSSTWMIGLFGLGMAAAVANFAPTSRLRSSGLLQKFPWIAAAAVLALVAAAAKVVLEKRIGADVLGFLQTGCLEMTAGTAAALLLVGYTDRLQSGNPPRFLASLLESRWATGLGHFSYSLYLVHYPLLAAVYLKVVLPLHLSIVQNTLLLVAIFVPLCLLLAWGWFRAFEKPFLKR